MAKAKTSPAATAAGARAAGATGTARAWVILRGYNSAVELSPERPEFDEDDSKPEARVFGPFESEERAENYRARMMKNNPEGLDTGEVR